MAPQAPQERAQQKVVEYISGLAAIPDDFAGLRRGGKTVTVEPWMAEALREAEARVRRLRLSVEQQLAETAPRPCARCRRPVIGRADRRYCSGTCRQAAYRSRRAPKDDDLAAMAPSVFRARYGYNHDPAPGDQSRLRNS
jgi:hypothetical protein